MDGSLNLAGGAGLNPEASGLLIGGATGGADLKPGVSGSTTGLDDEKCGVDCGADGMEGLIPAAGASDLTTGPDDENGVIV